MKENCEFEFHYNRADVKPTVLNGGYQIILANGPSYKKIMCVHKNNILINIPSHPYMLMNRSILCKCDVEAESNFLLESLAACENLETKTDLEIIRTLAFSLLQKIYDMFCKREKTKVLIIIQQNDKSTQRPRNVLYSEFSLCKLL